MDDEDAARRLAKALEELPSECLRFTRVRDALFREALFRCDGDPVLAGRLLAVTRSTVPSWLHRQRVAAMTRRPLSCAAFLALAMQFGLTKRQVLVLTLAQIKTLVKKEYHRRVLQCHPDLGGDEEVLKTLTSAFAQIDRLEELPKRTVYETCEPRVVGEMGWYELREHIPRGFSVVNDSYLAAN